MLNAKLMQKLPAIVALCCLLGCSLFVWKLVDSFFLAQWSLGISAPQVQPMRDTTRLEWYKASGVVAAVAVVEVTSANDELSEASINAQLLGILIKGDAAFAAIQTPQKPDGLYRIGDQIAANVELVRIEPNRVVVRERGAERQISMKSLAENGQVADESLLQTLPASNQGFSLSGVFGATPINVAGYGMAIRLDSVDDEVAQMSDLRAGDVVLAIGERPVAELIANPMAFNQFMQQSVVMVEVDRDGDRLQLTVNARSIGERIMPNIGQGMIQ